MTVPERKKEFSAGGVILKDGRLLLIKMRNLSGEEVWTFPKGHLEGGETPEAAALREVKEEAGLDCRVLRHLHAARYSFFRQGFPVDKRVDWFLMEETGGDGRALTPDEVLDKKWASPAEADGLLKYPSDREIMEALRAEKTI
ncbi:MAG TPA: NUDIX hydrolase [Elusimicrobia bacterium]|jgi:ADP-ribose pyrophosphatase YjhB (NUDIX family)|nr:NUDIX hydrolase [Elusimicrobiota bacterium]